MNLLPVGKRMLVEVDKAEDNVTSGGIILIQNDIPVVRCTIESIGDDDKLVEGVEQGDKALVRSGFGKVIKVSGRSIMIVSYSDVIAILKQDKVA